MDSSRPSAGKILHRYTNLAAVMHMLNARKITLLNPVYWDDKNDVYFMTKYKEQKLAKTLLALCFSESSERYHHWKVFASGMDGVRIEFEKDPLVKMFRSATDVVAGSVKYRTFKDIDGGSGIRSEELPFVKRIPYRDEREFRVIYSSNASEEDSKEYKIELSWIRRVTLSPWMPKPLYQSVKDFLLTKVDPKVTDIIKSTLIESDRWKKFASVVS